MHRTALLAASAALVAGVLARPAGAAPSAPAAFAHPGVTVSKGQLDFTRAKVNAGAQPWKGAFDQMMASKYADLNRTPSPGRSSNAVRTPTPTSAAPTSARTRPPRTPTLSPGTSPATNGTPARPSS